MKLVTKTDTIIPELNVLFVWNTNMKIFSLLEFTKRDLIVTKLDA